MLALVGTQAALNAIATDDLPITWQVLDAVTDPELALLSRPINPARNDNVLSSGRLRHGTDNGDSQPASDQDTLEASGAFSTPFAKQLSVGTEAMRFVRLGQAPSRLGSVHDARRFHALTRRCCHFG